MDTFSRRIVGWSAATNKETRLVLDALEMALWQRDRDELPLRIGELIHHSDAGSQNTSFKLAEHLDAAGIAASIGLAGDAYDNALMESTIGMYRVDQTAATLEESLPGRTRHRRVDRLVRSPPPAR